MKALDKPNKWGCTITMAKKEKCEACHRENESYKYSLTTIGSCPVNVSAYVCPYKQAKTCLSKTKCNGIHCFCTQCLHDYWREWDMEHNKEFWGFCHFIASQEQKVVLS